MNNQTCSICGQLLDIIEISLGSKPEDWSGEKCIECGRPLKVEVKLNPTGPRNVPTSVVGLIGAEYDKAIVVLISYDISWALLNCVTYGTTPGAKDLAAQWAEKCAVAIGGQMGAKSTYESFTATPQAEFQAKLEELRGMVVERDVVIEALKRKLEARKNLVVI